MIYVIAAVLTALWLLAMRFDYALGGFIHVLLVAAVVMALGKFMADRNRSALSKEKAQLRRRNRNVASSETHNLE